MAKSNVYAIDIQRPDFSPFVISAIFEADFEEPGDWSEKRSDFASEVHSLMRRLTKSHKHTIEADELVEIVVWIGKRSVPWPIEFVFHGFDEDFVDESRNAIGLAFVAIGIGKDGKVMRVVTEDAE